MQVLDVHAGFLSNMEVLQYLEDDVAQQDKTINAFKKKHMQKANQHSPEPGKPYFDFQAAVLQVVPDNVRTLQVEMLKYLKQQDLPASRQSPADLQRFMADLKTVQAIPDDPKGRGSNALTKTEKLMLVNLSPTSQVDLIIICDELERRFSEAAQEQLLEICIRHSAVGKAQQIAAADAALDTIMQEELEASAAETKHEQGMEQAAEDVYRGEEYAHQFDMPDEENDLVDETFGGSGGREMDVREIDEVNES